MYNPSIEELAKVGDSRYTLVVLTAKRARQLIEGAEPLMETDSIKPVSIAIEETINGKITYIRREREEESE